MIVCNGVLSVLDIVSTKMTNAIATKASINSDGKKVENKNDCYILETLLLVIILLLTIAIICYHYARHRSKQENNYAITI